MNEVRFAVLGCGRIGRMHADLLHRQVRGTDVTVVYDVMREAAEAVAGATGARVASSIAAFKMSSERPCHDSVL